MMVSSYKKYRTEQNRNWEIGEEKKYKLSSSFSWVAGTAQWLERRTLIQRSRVQFTVWAAGEFCCLGPTFCADSYFGTRFTSVLLQ